MEERRKQQLKFIEEIKRVIQCEIHKTVNAKIDKMSESFDDHKKEMQPILDAYKATNTLGRITIWISKVMLAMGVIVGTIIAFFKYFK